MRGKIIAAVCGVAGFGCLAAVPAQASVTPTEASQMCATTYQLGKGSTGQVPNFENPQHGQWAAQGRFIATQHGGNYAASTTTASVGGTASSSNVAPCHVDYTFLDGYGLREHVLMEGWVSVGRYSDGTPYPAAFGTYHRNCTITNNGATGYVACDEF